MPRTDLRSAPSLAVERGERVVLSTVGPTPRNAVVTRLRPRTAAALITLASKRALPAGSEELAQVNAVVKGPRRVARLSDAEAFDEVDSSEGLIDIRSLNGGARIGGYSAAFVRAVLARLEPDGEIPTHVHFRPPPHTARHARARAAEFELSLPVPLFIAEKLFVSVGPLYANILLGPDSTLVISDDVSHLICFNFVAYDSARVVQETPYLVVDVLGSMVGGTVFKINIADQPIENIVAKFPIGPLKIGDLPILGIQPPAPGI